MFYLYKSHIKGFYFLNFKRNTHYCYADGLRDELLGNSTDFKELIINYVIPYLVFSKVDSNTIYKNWPFESYHFNQRKYKSAKVYIGLNLLLAKGINLVNLLKANILYLSDEQAKEVLNELGLEATK